MPISDGEFNTLRARVDTLELEVSDVKSEILTLKNSFLLLQETVKKLDAFLQDNSVSKIAALEQKDKVIEQRMDGAEQIIGELDTDASFARSKINRLERQKKGLI